MEQQTVDIGHRQILSGMILVDVRRDQNAGVAAATILAHLAKWCDK